MDAAPEMLAVAASNVRNSRIRFVQADVFEWIPDQRYDVVFFGFWLSHALRRVLGPCGTRARQGGSRVLRR